MSSPAARPAAPSQHRRPPLPWIAVVADGGGLDTLDALGAAHRLVAPRPSGRGLAVVALDSAALPLHAERDEVGVVFEGLLQNRRELARELGLEPADAVSSAEVVIAAYRRWGEAMPERLRGPYALVLWDGREQRLIASRDRVGVYPLVYAEVGAEIVLSTSADLVRRHPRVPTALNRARIAELICLRIFDVRESGYAAIRRLAPAHRLVRDPRGAREEPNWILRGIGTLPGTLDDHLEQFETLLRRAVERAVEPGRLGILLSGGIDSVSVAATAVERCRALGIEPPLAMALAFPDAEANEEDRQRQVAAQLGLPLVLREFFEASGGRERALYAAGEASRRFPSPALTIWRPAYLRLLADGQATGLRTVLTGHGGDEWLSVSIYIAADYIQRLQLGRLWREFRTHRRSFGSHLLRSAQFVFWQYGARPVLAAAAVRALGDRAAPIDRRRKRRAFRRLIPDWVAPDPAFRRELIERAERYLPSPPPGDFYDHAVEVSRDHPAGDWEYEEIFEVGRQVGVSFASPYLDEDLVEFLVGVPPERLHAGGRTKGLVRSALARSFPGLGFERQKKVSATTFFRSIIREGGPAALAELGDPVALAEMGVVDVGALRSYTARAFSREPTHEIVRLWYALSTESWARERR